jgi:hypothetical protein
MTYISIFMELFWIFVISSKSKNINGKENLFLSEDGELPISIDRINASNRFLDNLINGYWNAGVFNNH